VKAEQAELLAIQALGHIAAEEELLYAFLGMTGLSPDELRGRAADPEILGGVLDFLLMDEARVLAFCGAAGIPPDRPARARRLLPGGEEVNWT
jgi:hypothetical protein